MTPTLTVQSAETSATHVVVLSVDGAGARPIKYSKAGLSYRPTKLTLVYFRRGDGPWKADRPELSGQKLKKGSDPATRVAVRETFWPRDPVPEWVSAAVAANMPAVSS